MEACPIIPGCYSRTAAGCWCQICSRNTLKPPLEKGLSFSFLWQGRIDFNNGIFILAAVLSVTDNGVDFELWTSKATALCFLHSIIYHFSRINITLGQYCNIALGQYWFLICISLRPKWEAIPVLPGAHIHGQYWGTSSYVVLSHWDRGNIHFYGMPENWQGNT